MADRASFVSTLLDWKKLRIWTQKSGREHEDAKITGEKAAAHFDAFQSVQGGGGGGSLIDTRGYCLALASLVPQIEESDKLLFAFELFDEDGSHCIDEREFEALIKCLLVGKSYDTDTLNSLLNAEFEAADTSGDGSISFQEFTDAVSNSATIQRYFKSLAAVSRHTQEEQTRELRAQSVAQKFRDRMAATSAASTGLGLVTAGATTAEIPAVTTLAESVVTAGGQAAEEEGDSVGGGSEEGVALAEGLLVVERVERLPQTTMPAANKSSVAIAIAAAFNKAVRDTQWAVDQALGMPPYHGNRC